MTMDLGLFFPGMTEVRPRELTPEKRQGPEMLKEREQDS
jgi:hypothetical protein